MMYFRKMIEQFVDVSDNEWEDFCRKLNKVTIEKGETIHHSGQVFRDIYFVKSGLSRSYFTDVNGKDFTWQLYFRGKSKHGLNHFLDDSVSYYENTGSLLNFEALETSVFYKISLKELDLFIASSKKWSI